MNAAALFDLSGRTALVTGAASGIGAAIAVGLASAGADVVVHGRRAEALDQVEAAVLATGRNATRWGFDLSDPDGIQGQLGGLPEVDILVNNAGMIHRQPTVDLSLEDWRAGDGGQPGQRLRADPPRSAPGCSSAAAAR